MRVQKISGENTKLNGTHLGEINPLGQIDDVAPRQEEPADLNPFLVRPLLDLLPNDDIIEAVGRERTNPGILVLPLASSTIVFQRGRTAVLERRAGETDERRPTLTGDEGAVRAK